MTKEELKFELEVALGEAWGIVYEKERALEEIEYEVHIARDDVARLEEELEDLLKEEEQNGI